MLLMSIVVFLVSFSLPAAFAQKSEVLFWTGHSGQPERGVMDQMVARFNELFPEINVKKVVVPGAETEIAKLLTSLAAGVGPDTYHLDRFTVSQRASAGILQSLEGFVPGIREWVEETYLDFGWKEVVYQDKVWGLPFDTDVRALYYRKDFFDEAGLSAPATIAETDAAAEKLTVREAGKLQRMGFVPWWNQGWHYTWGWAFGGQFYNADTQKITANDPRIVESFAWQKSYLDKYGMKDVQAFSSSYQEQMEVLDPFVSGKVAMVITGDWFIGNMRRFGPDVDIWSIGGPFSLRGYDSYAFSGSKLGFLNLEYRFPFIDRLKLSFPLPIEFNNIRGVLFADFGGVYTDSFKVYETDGGFHFQDLKMGIGGGVRFSFLYLIFKFDYARAHNFNEWTDDWKFHFTIGPEW